jgi:hypothetical protein
MEKLRLTLLFAFSRGENAPISPDAPAVQQSSRE